MTDKTIHDYIKESNDLKRLEIIDIKGNYIFAHYKANYDTIHIYVLTTYNVPTGRGDGTHKTKTGILSCGTWYKKEYGENEGRYFDSGIYYGNGKGWADNIADIIAKY